MASLCTGPDPKTTAYSRVWPGLGEQELREKGLGPLGGSAYLA